MNDFRENGAPVVFAEGNAINTNEITPEVAEGSLKGDLRGTAAPVESRVGSSGKIFGALIVGAVVVGIGAYSVATGMWSTQPQEMQRVASNDLPAPPTLPREPAMKPTTAPPDVMPPTLDAPVQTAPQAAVTPRVQTARVAPVKTVTERPAAKEMSAPVPPTNSTDSATSAMDGTATQSAAQAGVVTPQIPAPGVEQMEQDKQTAQTQQPQIQEPPQQ